MKERENKLSKTQKFLVPIIFLCISCIILIVGYLNLGLFDNLNISGFLSTNPVNVNYTDNTQAIDTLNSIYLGSSKEYDYSSKEYVYSVIYDIHKDLSSDITDVSEIKNKIYLDFDFLRNFIPDIIYIKVSKPLPFTGLSDTDGTSFDVIEYIIECTKSIGAEPGLIIDESFVVSDGALSFDNSDIYLSDYDFQQLIFSPNQVKFEESFYSISNFLSDNIKSKYNDILFGVEIYSDLNNGILNDFTKKILDERLIDLALTDIDHSTLSSDISFDTLAYYWNYTFSQYNIPCICKHRTDLVFTNEDEWGFSTEINNQLDTLNGCPTYDGSCFNSLSALKNKKALARELSIYLNDVSSDKQKQSSIQALSISGNNICFTGYASDNAYIFCNDKQIHNNNGSFSVNFKLKPGYNPFSFSSHGSTYSYPVINVDKLIYSYGNITEVYNSSSKEITPFAICPTGSTVYAIFNSVPYQMLQSNETAGIPEGYSVFRTSFNISKLKITAAELSVFCGYQQITDSVSCGTITDKNVIAVKETAVTTSDSISPFNLDGNDRALMCLINSENTEQISTKEDYDTYHPYKSSLIKGTIDYIKNINVSNEGYLRYELMSGINVYGTDCILINNGCALPLNNAKLLSSDNTDDSIAFCFSMDWLSPVTVSLSENNYQKGYQGFSYNIDSFTSRYVDINLYYTSELSIENQISFSQDSVFSAYEIINNPETQITVMRLYLRESGKFYGFDINTNENGEIIVSFKKCTDNSISGKVIMLDPGHGGISMVGTATYNDEVSEASVTLAIAHKTKEYLEKMGAKVILTRTLDSSMTLSERTHLCETINPDIFISIHCDGSESPNESGTHTFYYTPFSQPLASSVHESLVKVYKNDIYTILNSNYKSIDRKIKYYPFYVTRLDNCPSVLIETGFLTNYTEGMVLINPEYQDKLARGIANGLYNYYDNQN